jgi:hypothetical protein
VPQSQPPAQRYQDDVFEVLKERAEVLSESVQTLSEVLVGFAGVGGPVDLEPCSQLGRIPVAAGPPTGPPRCADDISLGKGGSEESCTSIPSGRTVF